MTDETKPAKPVMELNRGEVLSLLIAIGWKNATKWDNARLAEKIPQIKDVVPSQPLADEKLAKMMIDLLAAAEAGNTFVVTGEDVAGTTAGGGGGGKGKGKKVELTEEQKAEKAKLAEARKAEKQKIRDEKKAERDKAKEAAQAAKVNRPKGIRPSTTNPYVAGLILKKHGLDVGITDEMLLEFDTMRGRSNPAEARFVLANTWHAINAWTGHIAPVDPPKKEGKAAAETTATTTTTTPAEETVSDAAAPVENSEKPTEEVAATA